MNHISRVFVLLTGLACTVAALMTAAPAAFATRVPPPGESGTAAGSPQVHPLVTGGMPGWQITLIAVGSALLAATLAVVLDRAHAARRRVTASSA